ncbi:MAG TPA: tetratricopeptide repeat protein [Acidobacteriaceae bacterium]
MMNLNGFQRHFWMRATGWMAAIVIAGGMGFGTAGAMAQGADAWGQRIETLRGQIKSAELAHAGAAQLGGLWLQLANRYQDQLNFGDAQDAFVKALRLLRGAGVDSQYADALDGMASLELATGQLGEARDFDKQALAVYETTGDKTRVGKMHETIALSWLFEHHAREAEEESAKGLVELHAAAQPDWGEMVAALLTHGYALCFEKRCAEGLEDVNQARDLARAKFPEESLEMTTTLVTRGFVEWKLGAVDESDRAMAEAMRLAQGLTDLPQPVLVGARVQVMRQYGELLKATHRKPEAAEMEAQIRRLESTQPASCSRCTVSVAALGFMH